MQAFGLEDRGFRRTGAEDSARICRSSVIRSPKIVLRYVTSASRIAHRAVERVADSGVCGSSNGIGRDRQIPCRIPQREFRESAGSTNRERKGAVLKPQRGLSCLAP